MFSDFTNVLKPRYRFGLESSNQMASQVLSSSDASCIIADQGTAYVLSCTFLGVRHRRFTFLSPFSKENDLGIYSRHVSHLEM